MTVVPNPGAGAGVFDVNVFANCTGTQTDGFDGGLAGFQFDLLSVGTNKLAPLAAGGGPLAGKVKTTFSPSVATNFATLTPSKTDALPTQNPTAVPPYVADTDLDAPGGSFSDSGFKSINFGFGGTPQLIATEQWQLINGATSDDLRLYIIGPTYYNDGATATNFQSNFLPGQFTSGNQTVTVGAVPEPASIGMIGGLIGLAGIRRRKA